MIKGTDQTLLRTGIKWVRRLALLVGFSSLLSYLTIDCLDAGKPLFPGNLGCVQSSRADIRQFAEHARELGVTYIGLCCGASPSLLREVSEAYGRSTELSRFAPNTSRNYYMKTNLTARELKIKELLFGTITAQV
ncbi:betaine--homocysteine S-methyltransferase [Elysia marginata]|uniref:Betaine--homocysteine S-methyltransferase n=1 Tax=Elysia marginata TaxID=1093978 RepID=A0AAV4I6Q2_9GAST|nr:betaine--homocysteine S-methyltransferase [Elysia marginata]